MILNSKRSRFRCSRGYVRMGKVFVNRSGLRGGLSRDRAVENSAPTDPRFPRTITVAWLMLGIASVTVALITALVLRSERESTAVLHHLNLVTLKLQDVLSDLADAEAEKRGYLLVGRPRSLNNFERSSGALVFEFDQLIALVKNNSAERQEVE